MALGTVGLQAHDYINCGFERADVVICVGYDLVEYHPRLWHPTRDRKIIHIDMSPAEVDACYIVEAGVVGDIKQSLVRIGEQASPTRATACGPLRESLIDDMNQHGDDRGYPVKPQKIIWDLRTVLNTDDIVICDVGAHKLWMARMFRCEYPNTCIISNGFASHGHRRAGGHRRQAGPSRPQGGGGHRRRRIHDELPGDRDGHAPGHRHWSSSSGTTAGYGLIEWKQMATFGRSRYVKFNNPDFVQYAQSFGAKGYRVERTEDLQSILETALADDTVSIIDCPVDYRENLKLTEKLGEMVCQI